MGGGGVGRRVKERLVGGREREGEVGDRWAGHNVTNDNIYQHSQWFTMMRLNLEEILRQIK